MPDYVSFVASMTTSTKKNRETGLKSIASIVKHLPKEQHLAVAQEPGLLAAVEPFLRGGGKADTAIDLLFELVEFEGGKLTATTMKCLAAIFDSPCFSEV